MPQPQSLASMWEDGRGIQERFLQTAREVYALVNPASMPDVDAGNTGAVLPRPLSTIGARGFSNLSSKLSVGSFPPNTPFFRYSPDELALLDAGLEPDDFDDVKLALSKREKAIQAKLDRSGFRPVSIVAFDQLLGAGNYLVNILPDGRTRGFRLDQFQVRRNGKDEVTRILVKEKIARARLAPHIARQVQNAPSPDLGEARDEVELLTGVFLDESNDKKQWTTYQEVGSGVRLTTVMYMADRANPWIPLRMVKDANEDYGRSFAEQYLGDLEFVEATKQQMAEYVRLATTVIPIIKPGSMIKPNDLMTAANGKPIMGDPDGIGHYSVEKANDMQVALAMLQATEQELRAVFLLLTPFRNAERVTQEEIQQTVNELNESLAGPFSLLADEFQRPLVQKMVALMIRTGELLRIPTLEKLDADIKIVTGIDAIGRSREEANIMSGMQEAQVALGPDEAKRWIKAEGFLKILFAAKGLDHDLLIRTSEEVQAMLQAEQEAAQQLAATGPMVNAGAQVAQNAQQQQ